MKRALPMEKFIMSDLLLEEDFVKKKNERGTVAKRGAGYGLYGAVLS